MQNDANVKEELLNAGDEEYKKQLALLLEKRQQFRHFVPLHPADEPVVRLTDDKSTHQPVKQEAKLDHGEISKTGDQATSSTVVSKPENVLSSHLKVKTIPKNSYGLVVVSCTFRHLPCLSEKTKGIASALFDSLVDTNFNRFSRRGSKLLLNPSVIEFQDTLKELQSTCEKDSSFFLCLSSHGARVVKGVNEGSYVLFSETRLSSEDELLLTAVHEAELAKLIHAIPSRNKLIAFDLCHAREPKEAPPNVADSVRNQIHSDFSSRLYNNITRLHYEASQTPPSDSGLNTILLEACNPKSEISLSCAEDGVSNFLHRLNDAFRGGAVVEDLDSNADRRPLSAFEVIKYASEKIHKDAEKQNTIVKDEYMKQARTKYELAAEFQEITQTAQLLGVESAENYGLGSIPATPTIAPNFPQWVSSTLNSVTLSWSFPSAGYGVDMPAILGYHIQYRGDGRASIEADIWERASSFQVLTFEQVVREKEKPPTAISVFGLSSDTAYCFRVRARSAGGWGPFSTVSPGYRTHSCGSIRDQYSTVHQAVHAQGSRGVMVLMKKHSEVRSIQQHCIEELAKMAIRGASRRKEKAQFLPSLDMPIVSQVCSAMQKFKHDFFLQRHSCLFIGRLGASDENWRKKLLLCKEPSILALIRDVASRFEDVDYETHSCAMWAFKRLRGESTIIRRKLSKTDAARCIQGMYRTRKAREYVRTLAQAIYRQAVDPATGKPYFYNTRTGATSWSMPAFAS